MILPLHASLAHEFRIESEVFRGAESTPISSSLTLFEGAVIYDFLLAPDEDKLADEIAIFDTEKRQFVLLDVEREVKTIVPEHHLVRLLAAIRSKGVVKDEFLVNPLFEEKYDPSTGWITLKSERLTYRARGTRPEDGAVLPLYHQFIDQFARLNATDPRRMPPFARLKLNAAIKKYGIVPEVIEMSLQIDESDPESTIELQSKHFVMWQLSQQDREHIERAKRYWIRFREVDLEEYRDLPGGRPLAPVESGSRSE